MILCGYAILDCQHLDNSMILIFLAVLSVMRFCGIEREKEENSIQKNDILWCQYRYTNLIQWSEVPEYKS